MSDRRAGGKFDQPWAARTALGQVRGHLLVGVELHLVLLRGPENAARWLVV